MYNISINWNLSIKSSRTIDFSRLHACFSFKPYLFALAFALTSRNKGNFLFPADHLIQQPCGSTLRFPCRVSVNVHCGTDIRVSEKFLHIFRLCAVGQRYTKKRASLSKARAGFRVCSAVS